METPIAITDLTPYITQNADVLGVLCTKTDYTEKFLPLDVLLHGILRPDLSDNIDMTGIGLLNVRELSVTGLTNLVPYINGIYDKDDYEEDLNTKHAEFRIPVTTTLATYGYKNITLIEAEQADKWMLKFDRIGWYDLSLNSMIGTFLQMPTGATGTAKIEINVNTYDSGGDSITKNDRYSFSVDLPDPDTSPIAPIPPLTQELSDISRHVYIPDPVNTRLEITLVVNGDEPSIDTNFRVTTECNHNLGIYSRR